MATGKPFHTIKDPENPQERVMFLIIYKLNSLLNMLKGLHLTSTWEGDGQG